MLETSKPRLAIYAALAIAVLLIGARYLRSSGGGGAGGGDVAAVSGSGSATSSLGAPDGASGGVGADGTTSDDGGLDGSAAGSGDASDAAGADGTGASGAAASGSDAAGADAVVVDVKGAVRRPGVYRLAPGARALDAVHKAGGMTGKADRIGVNLAARVSDGGEVIVPAKGPGGATAAAGATSGTASASGSDSTSDGSSDGTATTPLSIDLNTASEEELEQLDGVGPATAQKILDYREQHGGIGSVDELDAVSGIGERKLAAIEAQLGQ